MKICLILSWAPYWKSPNRPSFEMRLAAYAAKVLYDLRKATHFYISSNVQWRGMREPELRMLQKLLRRMGIPRDSLIINPSADTTDGEIKSFKDFIGVDLEIVNPIILAPLCKRGRIEMILRNIDAKIPLSSMQILWVENVCATQQYKRRKKTMGKILRKWKRSPRIFWDRLIYGWFPLALMWFLRLNETFLGKQSIIRHIK